MFTKVEAKWGFTESAIVVQCDSEQDARLKLREEYEIWAELAARFGVPKTLLQYRKGRQTKAFKVLATEESTVAGPALFNTSSNASLLTINEATIAQVYSSPVLPCSKPLLDAMTRMIEAERPMFVTVNNGALEDRQVWLNQLACDMLRSSGTEAIQRNMKNYVEGGDLERMHQRLRDSSPGQVFDHTYRAKLNDEPDCPWMEATGRYEIVEVGNLSLRLTTTIDFKLIGQPNLVTFR